MAKIQPMTKSSSSAGSVQGQTVNKLMPAGEYRGIVVDIGFSTDKEQTRKILYAALARTDKEELSPRVIRARFDIWNPDLKIYGYAIDNLFGFINALEMKTELDTDDPELLHKLIQEGLFKNIYFKVDKLISQNGFAFNVVKHFKSVYMNAAPLSDPVQPMQSSSVKSPPPQEIQYNPAAFQPATPEETPEPLDRWVDDEVPF